MLKLVRLPVKSYDATWHINAITGSLIKSPINFCPPESAVPIKVKKALDFCENPYLLKSNLAFEDVSTDSELIKKIKKPYKTLKFLGNKWLLLSMLPSIRTNFIFENSATAFNHINELDPDGIGQNCLQKTLLVAKTSKSFKQSGVLFIGANLPTGHMHSWIIENDVQPDKLDRHWISYQPLLALHSA